MGLGFKAAQNLSAMGGVDGRTAKAKQELDECWVVSKCAEAGGFLAYVITVSIHWLRNLLALSFVLPLFLVRLSWWQMPERLQQCSWDLALPGSCRWCSAASNCQQVRKGDLQDCQPYRQASASGTHQQSSPPIPGAQLDVCSSSWAEETYQKAAK